MHSAKWKKQVWKGYTHSNWMTVSKGETREKVQRSLDVRGWLEWRKGWISKAEAIFRVVKLILYGIVIVDSTHDIMHLSKPKRIYKK